MYRGGFETLVVWVVLFIVFGPLAAAHLTQSLDTVVAQVTPYVGLLGGVVLVFLALRMFFRG